MNTDLGSSDSHTFHQQETWLRRLWAEARWQVVMKLGRCAKCIRWSRNGALGAGVVALGAWRFASDSILAPIAAITAIAFTTLLLLHIVVFAGRVTLAHWRATKGNPEDADHFVLGGTHVGLAPLYIERRDFMRKAAIGTAWGLLGVLGAQRFAFAAGGHCRYRVTSISKDSSCGFEVGQILCRTCGNPKVRCCPIREECTRQSLPCSVHVVQDQEPCGPCPPEGLAADNFSCS